MPFLMLDPDYTAICMETLVLKGLCIKTGLVFRLVRAIWGQFTQYGILAMIDETEK
jgi:hypothetical protein